MALSFEARDDAAIAVAGSYVVFPLSSRLTAWFAIGANSNSAEITPLKTKPLTPALIKRRPPLSRFIIAPPRK